MSKGRREYSPDELRFQQALGATIRRLRTRAGMSQEEFAARARLERSYIPSLESGRFDARISTLTRIAECLEVEADQLLKQVLLDARGRNQGAAVRETDTT